MATPSALSFPALNGGACRALGQTLNELPELEDDGAIRTLEVAINPRLGPVDAIAAAGGPSR